MSLTQPLPLFGRPGAGAWYLLFTLTLALAGFAPTGFAATDYINVQFSNGGASQTGAAVIGAAGDYWNKTSGKSGTNLSLNTTGNTSSGASLSWSATGVASTGTNNAFIAQNTAWKNLFSGHVYAASGSTMTASFSGLTPDIPVRVYFLSENDQGGNGRKLQASLNGGAYVATTVGSDNTVYTFIKDQNYLVVDGAANGSGQLNINLKGVSGARDGTGILMGIQLIASDDTPSLTIPNLENVGAGMATLLLQTSEDGTGYFTLLAGMDTACGTAAQVQAGLTSTGTTAPYHGSLPLTADTQGRYTVRNLTQLTDYTVCFTAAKPNLFPATPVSANLSTTAAYLSGPVWSVVGTAGFSAGLAYYTSLAFAPDGTPYVAYEDYGHSYKATVMKFNGTGWVAVGTAGFSASSAYFISLAFAPDGTPYVAYEDYGHSYKATVMKFNGTAWVTVGTAGFSASYVDYTSLAFTPDGTPYVAYVDSGNGNKATVMKFDGTAWVTVGAAGLSAGETDYTSLAFAPNGTPYVAYMDSGNSSKATVMKFNGTTWVTVGTAGFSAGSAKNTSLAVAPDGTAYLAYRDGGNSDKATVMKFNGTAWVVVGTAGFSSGEAYVTRLAFAPDGTPYLGYDYLTSNMMKFNSTAWVTVGVSAASSAAGTSLAFALDGTPYVAYRDGDHGYKATVMQFTNPATTTTLQSSPNPSSFGQSVTLTATVSPSTATGSVTFKDGSSTLGTLALSGGSATYVTSALSLGSHDLTAVYAGDSVYGGSTSTTLTQTINQTATTTAVGSSRNPSNNGGTVTFTATVSPAATGTVQFFDGASSLGLGTLNGSSQATVTTSALTVGSHSITAVYGGTAGYNGSTSPALTQTVNSSGISVTVVATNPAGLSMTVDGTDYTAPHTFNWISGSSHTLAVDSPQAGTTGTRYPFANWSDAGAQSHSITVPPDDSTYTATFITEHQLTTAATPTTGGVVLPVTDHWYTAGSTVDCSATPSDGYRFVSWSGPVADANTAATTVTMAGPRSVTATLSDQAAPGVDWTIVNTSSAADNLWFSVTYGNGLFVAVAGSGTGNRVMTSPDGITWTSRTSAADNAWYSVTYGNGLFVAVAGSGTGNRVMTSPDGSTWTIRTSAANNTWNSVTYGNGLFVATAISGTANRVMTSPDGITWTARTNPVDNQWASVTYGNGLFVAVGPSGTGNRVMTSPDGIDWTIRTSAADNNWMSVTYGNGLFVAVTNSGTGNRVMTSPDGINWTARTSAADNSWYSVAYGNNRFVAVASDGAGNRVMISPGPSASQTITVDQAAPASAAYGATFDVKAHAGSGLAVAVTTGGACSGSGSSSGNPGSPVTIAMTGGVGTCTVNFDQGGNSSYSAATQVVETTTAQKATPTATLNVTNSPVTYDGAPHAATVGITVSSVPGAVSAILTGGAATQTATGTYPVTATFTPNDPANYATLNGLSAGNFVITAPGTVEITVATAPAGRTLTVDGTDYTAPHTFTWTIGSSHTLAAASPQTDPGSRYTFSAWSDSGSQSHSITVPATAGTYTATFTAEYQLTTAVTPATGGFVLPLTGTWYTAGSTVNVSVTPSTGYKFASWSGPVADANSAATTVTLSGPQSVTATLTGVPALTAKVTGKSGAMGTRLWTVTLTNTGTGTATAVSLTGITITKGTGVTCTPVVKTGVPVAVADVASGTPQTAAVTIDFAGCAATNKFNVQFSYTYGDGGGGTYTGGDSFYNMMR